MATLRSCHLAYFTKSSHLQPHHPQIFYLLLCLQAIYMPPQSSSCTDCEIRLCNSSVKTMYFIAAGWKHWYGKTGLVSYSLGWIRWSSKTFPTQTIPCFCVLHPSNICRLRFRPLRQKEKKIPLLARQAQL